MKRLYTCLAIFLLSQTPIFSSHFSYGQGTHIQIPDSVINALENAQHDTSRVNLLIKFSDLTKCTDTLHKLDYARRALDMAEKIKWRKGMVAAVDKISEVYFSCNRDYIKAIYWNKKGEKLTEAAGDTQTTISFLNNIAISYSSISEFSEALKYFRQCMALKPSLTNEIGIKGNMGLAYRSLGDYPKALAYYEESYKLLNQYIISTNQDGYNDTLMMMGLLKTIADIYLESSQIDKALENYERILTINREVNFSLCKIWALMGIGQCYHLKKDYGNAIQFYAKALKQCREKQNYENESEILNDIGNLYLETGDINNAMQYSRESLLIAEGQKEGKEKLKDLSQVSQTETTLGIIYTKLKDYKKAGAYLLDAINICKKAGAMNNEKEAWLALGDAYTEMKEPVKALEAYKYYYALRDSVYSQGKARELTRIDMQGEFDRKQLSDSLANAKKDEVTGLRLQRQKLLSYGGFAGLALVLLLSFFVYRNYNNEKKANVTISLANEKIKEEKQVSEKLLLNILPADVAEELKMNGDVQAKQFDDITVLFSDFVNFTRAGERLTAKELVAELNTCFTVFDEIISKYNIEKIKTVGDAYLAVAGLPTANPNHACDIISAAIEIRDYMATRQKQLGELTFGVRLGVNSGSVVAGIVGVKKFAYDIWGDTVNTAARMEQDSQEGKINITETTYELVKHKYLCSYRGEVASKNKGKLKMYFVEGAV